MGGAFVREGLVVRKLLYFLSQVLFNRSCGKIKAKFERCLARHPIFNIELVVQAGVVKSAAPARNPTADLPD